MVSQVGFGQWLSAAWSPLPTNPPLRWPRPEHGRCLQSPSRAINFMAVISSLGRNLWWCSSTVEEKKTSLWARWPSLIPAMQSSKYGKLRTIWSCHGWLIPWRLRLVKFSSLLHCHRCLGCDSLNTILQGQHARALCDGIYYSWSPPGRVHSHCLFFCSHPS